MIANTTRFKKEKKYSYAIEIEIRLWILLVIEWTMIDFFNVMYVRTAAGTTSDSLIYFSYIFHLLPLLILLQANCEKSFLSFYYYLPAEVSSDCCDILTTEWCPGATTAAAALPSSTISNLYYTRADKGGFVGLGRTSVRDRNALKNII